MNHDERHQEECEERRWYEEGPESESWKRHERSRQWLKEQIDAHKRKWSGRDI